MAALGGIGAKLNSKRALIDKANANMLIIIGITSFIVTFSLVSCKALFSQSSYQGHVIKAKETALKQLKDNNKNIASLVSSYTTFASGPVNVLGGNPNGSGPLDGDNPKIILDALPSKYDYPGFVSGLGKLLEQSGFKAQSIGGTDDEVAQQNSATDDPAPVEIPFPLSISTNYDGAHAFLLAMERSIRPVYISNVALVASGDKLSVSITAKTYYLPAKTLKIGTKVIK